MATYIYRLHLSIDHALAVSYRRNQYGENPSFVARITLVKGIPFYGFHVGYRFFLKIYMFNPIVMTRLADLLQQGVIMKHKFQPYEAHLQYLLQFMTDYNLYGCDYLDSSKTYFRLPVPDYEQASNSSHRWHTRSVPLGRTTADDDTLRRVSHCSIEVDICVHHIVNRKKVKERPLHHDFVERVHPLPSDVKLVYSMAGLWDDETKRRRRQMQPMNHTSSPFPPEVLVSMSADVRESQPQGWIHEDEYREQVDQLISQECKNGQDALTFDNFTKPTPFQDTVQTALQSVEDLYPSTLLPLLGLPLDSHPLSQDPASSIEVDEQKMMQTVEEPKMQADEGFEDFFFPSDSDEEALTMLYAMEKSAAKPSTSPHAAKGPESLHGEVQELDKAPLEIPMESLPWQSLHGICRSGLATGTLPDLPPCKELVDVAEKQGLLGRSWLPFHSDLSGQTSLKRTASALPNQPEMKRVKRETPSPFRSEQEEDFFPDLFSDIFSQTPKPRSVTNAQTTPNLCSPNNSQSPKTTSSKRAAPKRFSVPADKSSVPTLSFAIVKDQHDPNTRLRLSQKSQTSSSSQQSEAVTPKKHVAFEPITSSDIENWTQSQLAPSSSVLSLRLADDNSDHLLKAQQAVAELPSPLTILSSNLPPSASTLFEDLKDQGFPQVVYQDAYFSRQKDCPKQTREYAGREFRLKSNALPFLPEFDPTGTSSASHGLRTAMPDRAEMRREYRRQRQESTIKSWEILKPPPSCEEVKTWWDEKQRKHVERTKGRLNAFDQSTPRRFLSQIDGPTPRNKHAFKYSQKQKSTSVEHQVQYMSTMSLEIHVNTRGKFVPNPEEDRVECVFWALKSDEATLASQEAPGATQTGIVVLSEDGDLARRIQRQTGVQVVEESSELDLLVRMVEVVRTADPDVLTGYEVHGGSWGYLIERARLKYDYNLCDEFSRMKTQSHGRFGKESDRWGFNTTSTIRVTGRHMINIWRAMRGELNLLQYTMENVVWHLLHQRIPHYSWKSLTTWYRSGKPRELGRLLEYYQTRTRLDIDILDANELIARTSEQARLLGVDFFSVFSRGSQFKVESIMFRIAKPENFILVSPNRKQVGGQNALECLPLVMEPQSAFYNSPLIVLDFQSLYPSVMIAYNYCYSTFLGRITNWRGMNKMGFTEYKRQQGLLALLREHINIAPNGMMYAKTEIRKSLLAKMLTEILETRVMVKSGMKQDKDDKTLQQLLNNRQLALKLLANVTYGYTSASFSGRMPCSEIADSIVQTARETLERAIAFIHSVDRWGAEVVYGDTDSLFVYLKGRTKDEAFDIGNEMAKAITEQNPRPIKLKFEKVYHPCVLLAKKRYVGYKYESKGQTKPEFDAKGIETVRRDGTPAEQKIEERALRLLFETADLSKIKAYFQSQCSKIMRNNVSVQDFCFAKEVRLGTYSDKGPPPPGALISTKKMLEDARAEPQYGERVPYVVITGAPGARLIDRCVAPEELLNNPQWRLDAEYYISKNLIPPLERIFNLMGANVRQWYDEMPKIRHAHHATMLGARRTTIESYLKSTHCLVCHRRFSHRESSLCHRCRTNVPASLLTLQSRVTTEERKMDEILSLCRSCSGVGPLEEIQCDSKDCPAFWSRMRQWTKMKGMRNATNPVILALTEGAARRSLEW